MADTTKKTSERKAAPRKKAERVTEAAPAKKTAAKKKAAAAGPQAITPDQRRQFIAEAAYFRAQRQGFDIDPVECWLAAEKEIDAWLLGAESVH